MSNIRKILAPVDFSEAAVGAVRYADAVAEHFGADVTLLHVAPPVAFEFSMTEPTRSRYQEFAEHRNRTVRHALEHFPGDPPLKRPVKRQLAEGGAGEEIVRISQDGDYDLIVLPTRGSNAIKRWLIIGSVTSEVLHGAECPVIAAREFGDQSRGLRLRHIVCAIDLGPQSERVLCSGHRIAQHFGARLTVVHAAPSVGESVEDFFDESWRVTVRSRLLAKTESLVRQANVQGDIVVEPGDPHKVVPQVAARSKADLVVIGRGVSNGLIGRLRAHAYEIIRQSPVPVLSV